MKRILSVLLLALWCIQPAMGQVCDSVILPGRLDACKGTLVTMPASVRGTSTIDSIIWAPAGNVSNFKILTPTVTSEASAWYAIDVYFTPNDVAQNGNFDGGNTGFTSDYLYGSPPTMTIGGYGVTTDPASFTSESWPSFGDHTTGSGNMLLVDGASTGGLNFWCQTIPVSQNTQYDFTVWIAQLIAPPPKIELHINSATVATFWPLTSDPIGKWVQYSATWNSGVATSATFCMTDLNYTLFGNDFAVDDIKITQHCKGHGDIYVDFHSTPTVDAGFDINIMAGQQAQLRVKATGADTIRWAPAESLSCNTCLNPVASMTVTTTYTVTGTSVYGCTAKDEVTVHLLCDNNQLFVPSAFSPNGDGENDIFYVRGSGIKEVKNFKVFNRWGELVYSRENCNVNDPASGWDGRVSGRDPRPDVFVWFVEATCYTGEPMFIKGDVALIR